MDAEEATSETAASLAGAPGSAGAVPALRATSDDRAAEGRTHGVFARLVKGDGDIVGLVAYSIYKQNKLDWLRAFQSQEGRTPDAAELASYLCGESTIRRLVTYRHLAEATLAGRGPHAGESDDAHAGTPVGVAQDERRFRLAERTGASPGQIAVYALIAAVFVVGVVLAFRFTAAPR